MATTSARRNRPTVPIAMTQHEAYMSRAIELALLAEGNTHPNPRVGAVLVKNGIIIAEAYHKCAGELHAERALFESISTDKAIGATLYVTLEPCSTYGRTPPCTDCIIDAGVKHVVIGTLDPNPKHAGRGVEILESKGIEVTTGILAKACECINTIFNHTIVRQEPLFALKTACTLDGRIATRSGESQWITGPEARADVMQWRRYFPAIAVGAGTALGDDPALTSRIEGKDDFCPLRFVFDRSLQTADAKLQLYDDCFKERTIVVTSDTADPERQERLRDRGISIWSFTAEPFDWVAFRNRCMSEGISGVFFEAGAQLAASLITYRQVDYLFQYQAPKIFADESSKPAYSSQSTKHLTDAICLDKPMHKVLGEDALICGSLKYPKTKDYAICYLASGNSHKRDELQKMFTEWHIPISLKSPIDGMPDVDENANTFEGNARLKAKALREIVDGNAWILADDSGLEVDAIGGAPGIHSARYAGPKANDQANNQKLLSELKDTDADSRQARFVCTLVLDTGKHSYSFRGTCEGAIADSASGEGGFGYDPLFIPNGYDESIATLGQELKNRISHRAQALRKLANFISRLPQT